MLEIEIKDNELWDENIEQFIPVKHQILRLEHSLVSLSKWEEKWHKPFLVEGEKTDEEILDYIRCMTITQNVDPYVYYAIDQENLMKIRQYIDDPHTATWISENPNDTRKKNDQIITSELIYCWMFMLQIPMECQKWHLNRLLMLIRVCSEENKPKEKMSKREILERNRAINRARRAKSKVPKV